MKVLSVVISLLGALAVVGGAFGAHALKAVLSPYQMEIYTKGIQYQFIHVITSLCIVVLYKISPSRILGNSTLFLVLGIGLFSGSLYVLTWLNYKAIAVPVAIALLTPAGGLCFITGWLLLSYYFIVTGKAKI